MSDCSKKRYRRDYTVHMIGNAHIDPVWFWRWKEGKAEVIATCRSALDRMKETPTFIFFRSSAVTYRWLEEDEPEMFEEIRQRVREGRWNIVNGWWVQPDCNLPCGESFVRQGLYGQRYFMDRFGVRAKVGYNVDSFGHCATLPQILKKCGLDYYVFFRPGPHEKDLPSPLFWWEAPDGSRVLACRPPHHYNSGPDEIEERILQAYEETLPGLRDVMCFYGVGNHGGGPTKRNIQSILKLDADPAMPAVRFSTPDAFFEKVLPQCADLPVVREDLQHHARGCYTSVSALKRHHRRCESLLMTAEKFASVVHGWFDGRYPQRALVRGWKHVLFNQFHDILGGTCIRPACEDAEALYRETYRMAGGALDEALHRIAARVDGHPGRGRFSVGL